MEKPITLKSMFDGRSHHGSFSQHLWHRYKKWLIVRKFACVAMIGIGGYFAMKTYGRGDKFANFITVSFVLIGSIGIMRPMIWQMWSERKLRKHPAFETEIRYSFGEEEIIMDGKSGKVSVPWCALTEVVETKKGLLLYQNKKDYIWIPASDFSDGEMGQVVKLHAAAC